MFNEKVYFVSNNLNLYSTTNLMRKVNRMIFFNAYLRSTIKGYLNFAISTLISLTSVYLHLIKCLDCLNWIGRLLKFRFNNAFCFLCDAISVGSACLFQLKHSETINSRINRPLWFSLLESEN